MLPSGNDAAALLAFYYGYWLDKESTFPNLIFSKARKADLRDKIKYTNLITKRFIQYLNENIIKNELNHKNTHLENPHGLSNKFQVPFFISLRSPQLGKSLKPRYILWKIQKYFHQYKLRNFD